MCRRPNGNFEQREQLFTDLRLSHWGHPQFIEKATRPPRAATAGEMVRVWVMLRSMVGTGTAPIILFVGHFAKCIMVFLV